MPLANFGFCSVISSAEYSSDLAPFSGKDLRNRPRTLARPESRDSDICISTASVDTLRRKTDSETAFSPNVSAQEGSEPNLADPNNVTCLLYFGPKAKNHTTYVEEVAFNVTHPLYFGPRVEEVALGIFPTFLVAKNLEKCAKN